MSETHLVTSILQALELEPGVYAWRNSTGMIRRAGRVIKFGAVGSPDILAIVGPEGRLLGLEAKTSTGKQSPKQCEWQALIDGLGGKYAVVRSVSDALKAVRDARRGHT